MKTVATAASLLAVTLTTAMAWAAPPKGVVVTLLPDKPQIVLGEASFATFRVHNGSDKPVTLHVEWLARNALGRPECFEVSATSDKDVTVPVPELVGRFGGRSWHLDIGPGKHHDMRLFLPNWAPFSAAGTYTIEAVTRLEFGKPGTAKRHELVARAKLEVLAADPVAMEGMIAMNGLAMRSGRGRIADEAARRLVHTHDARVVPLFIAELKRPDYTRKLRAIRVLGNWNTDAAIIALEAASKTRASDLDPERFTKDSLRIESAAQLRVTTAYALATSPHPRSGSLLLSMRNDPYSSVRLIVAQNAEKAAPGGARELLKSFTKDADALVAKESRRLLDELPH
jgi:hypothetical protein